LTGIAPGVNAGKAVQVPVASIELAGLPLDLVGRPRTSILVPQADTVVTIYIPSIATGASVAVPLGTIVLQSLKPSTIGKLDTEAFDLFLLVEDDLLSLRNP
jgi:hypothetical protein